jgi:hypothetical protein
MAQIMPTAHGPLWKIAFKGLPTKAAFLASLPVL